MKKLAISVLSVSLLSLLACHKDPVKPPVTPPTDSTTIGTLKINLISSEPYWPDTVKTNVELVISEPGGKVLLDTITPANTHITAALSTNATTVDLTNIYYDTFDKIYIVRSFKNVNPSGWAGDYSMGYYQPYGPRPQVMTPDTLTFTNLPSTNDVFFSQNLWTGENENLTIPNTFIGEYDMIPGNYAYLLCGTAGQYKMIIPTQDNETVDCSTMDKATSASFTPSSYFTYYASAMYGYPDSSNQNSEIWLYYNDSTQNLGTPQLQYPTKNIQKYVVFGYFGHGTNEYAQWYACSNTVNTNITYPDPASYSISATQNNHFAMSWNAVKPTYYVTSWGDSAMSYVLFASPDSTTLNPLGLLTAQKPKMLQGQDLTKLTLDLFQFEAVQGYNYAGYFGLTCDSSQVWKTLVSSGVLYSKVFQ